MVSRRGFLGWTGGTAAVAVGLLAPQRTPNARPPKPPKSTTTTTTLPATTTTLASTTTTTAGGSGVYHNGYGVL